MPILKRENDVYPAELFENPQLGKESDAVWWAVYTKPRQEKSLARVLERQRVSFYLPQQEQKFRSRAGRSRISYEPLFPSYIFMYGDEQARYRALDSGSVVHLLTVPDGGQLTHDLRQLKGLIDSGVQVTPEDDLTPGTLVRVTTGPYMGFEGYVFERRASQRLLIMVNYMQRGISVELLDAEVERITTPCG